MHCLKIIDPVARWVKLEEIQNEPAEDVALEFDRTWLTRCLRPNYCMLDKGPDFSGEEFQEIITTCGIKHEHVAAKNPQENAIIEHMHATLGDMLRTFELDKQIFDDKDLWTGFLSSIVWDLISSVYAVLNSAPEELVIGHNMMLPMTFKVDWE